MKPSLAPRLCYVNQMDVTSYLNYGKPELTNSRLERIVNRDDTSDLEAYSKEVGFRNMRDFIQYLIVYSKIKLLKKLIDSGLDVNYGLGHGILLVMCFSGGKIYLETLLFLLRYRLDVNFYVNYNGIVTRFLDLVAYISCSNPVIKLLITIGAEVSNVNVIPFNLNSNNVDYNIFLLREIYSNDANINNTSAVEFLMKEDYKRYSQPISQLGINPDTLSTTVRLLILSVLPVSSRLAGSILISLSGRLSIDSITLPLTDYNVQFEDVINLIRSLKVSVLSQVDWNVDCLCKWLFQLPCDTSKLVALRDEGINFNEISSKITIREDWQLALIQIGLAGHKSRSRIMQLGSSDVIIPQNNTNNYLISSGILKQYREYSKRQSRKRHSRSASLNGKSSEYEPEFDKVNPVLTPR